MKKIFLFLITSIFFISTIFAALPYPGRCFQRGFEMNGTHCFLPDGSSCKIVDFEEQTCGEEYQNFCIEEGKLAWKAKGYPCCEEMIPYLPRGYAGQTSCHNLPPLYERITSSLKYDPFWWFVEMIALIFAISVIVIKIKLAIEKSRNNQLKK